MDVQDSTCERRVLRSTGVSVWPQWQANSWQQPSLKWADMSILVAVQLHLPSENMLSSKVQCHEVISKTVQLRKLGKTLKQRTDLLLSPERISRPACQRIAS
eukprot:4883626-Amphidinium_carterae.2